MIAKIKIICTKCYGSGYHRHQHLPECYASYRGHQSSVCNCIKELDKCIACKETGYLIYIGELVEEEQDLNAYQRPSN